MTLAPEIEPSEAGFDATRLARLDAYLDACVADDLHKGSLIALARRGKVFHVSARGYRDAEAGAPVELDTIWRIYADSRSPRDAIGSQPCRCCSSPARSGTTRSAWMWPAERSRLRVG